MNARFQIWIRGVLCEVRGYIDPADRSVGIMGDTFIWEEIHAVDGDPTHNVVGAVISEADEREIDRAFWESLPIGDADLNVYDWQADQLDTPHYFDGKPISDYYQPGIIERRMEEGW